MKRGATLAILFAFALWVAAACGQSAPATSVGPSNETGPNPFVGYTTSAGTVNLATGNLTLEIPLVTLPGRAGNVYNLSLQYDSKNWVPHYTITESGTDITYVWQIERRDPQIGDLGWRLNLPTVRAGAWKTDGDGNHIGEMSDIVTLPDGTKHAIGETIYSDVSLDSEDGFDVGLDTTFGYTVRLKDGTAIWFNNDLSLYPTKIVDTNGNITELYKDTIGRQFSVTSDGGQPLPPAYPASITYKDGNGIDRTVTFTYSAVTLFPTDPLPPFQKPVDTGGCPNCQNRVWVTQPPYNSVYKLLTAVTLPNTKQYTFEYNGYGELTKITYPTGGYTSFGYGRYEHFENMWPHGDGSSQMVADFREVTSQNTCDGSGTCGMTTYTPTIGPTFTVNDTMNVVRENGAHLTKHKFFQVPPGNTACSKYYTPRETDSWMYEGATDQTALLRTVHTEYNSYACDNKYLPSSIQTTIDGNHVTREEFVYDTYTAHVIAPFGLDPSVQSVQDVVVPIGNVTVHREYDYGSGVPGPLLRTTTTDWLKTANGYPYSSNRAIHILDRKLAERVSVTGDPAKDSETQYEYDVYSEGLTASGATQHESGFGTSYIPRGNLTAVRRWRDTDNVYLVTRNQYDDAGNLTKTVDPSTPGTHATTYSYDDLWGQSTCQPATGYAKAYATLVTNAKGYRLRTKYYACSGLPSAKADENDIVANREGTTYTYDLMNRLNSVVYPDGGSVSYQYNDAAPVTVTRRAHMRSGSADELVSTTQYDGLGREYQTRLDSDPDGVTYVDTRYDAAGRKYTVSNPYRSLGDPTYGITTYLYDPLGRLASILRPDGSTLSMTYAGRAERLTDEGNGTLAVQRISQKDALGRVNSVCEVTGTTLIGTTGAPVACGQDIAATGFLTSYSYDLRGLRSVTQGGLAQRNFGYNSLGQLISASNPESGLTTYTYDDCGNLSSRIRPAPNQTNPDVKVTTTYHYDQLHRLTSTDYDDGVTPSVAYSYDEPSIWGMSPENPYGRMTHSVANGRNEVFSYDEMGRTKQHRQCIPPNCSSNFDITYGYDFLGNVETQTLPSVPLKYCYTTAGRLEKMKANSDACQ